MRRKEPKGFSQRRPDGQGGWINDLNSVQRVPYRLPEMLTAIKAGQTIYIPEGEKDVDALRGLGLAGTCNSGGANNWQPELDQWFGGADIVLLADNDDAGRKHAASVAARLCNVAQRVRVLDLPGLPHKGDVSDWIENGGDAAQLAGLVLHHAREVPKQDDPHEEAAEPGEGAGQASKFTPIAFADCRVDHNSSYVIKGVLAERDLALIIGQPGAGKSVLAPYLAHAIATGREVFNRRVKQKRVLYIAAEAGRDMQVRFAAMRNRLGQADGLFLIAEPIDLRGDNDDFLVLRVEIERIRPEVIVVDTIAAAFPGLEENESGDMGRAVRMLRSLGKPAEDYAGAAVVAVHHPPKEGNTPRGHGSLNGDADVTLRVAGEDDQVRTVTFGKNRNGPSGHAFDFAIDLENLGEDEDGDLILRPVAREVTDAKPTGAKLTGEEQGWLKDIVDFFAWPDLAQENVVPLPDMVPLRAATRDQIRDWLRKRGRIGVAPDVALDATDRSKLLRYLNRLKDKGKLGLTDTWVWLL